MNNPDLACTTASNRSKLSLAAMMILACSLAFDVMAAAGCRSWQDWQDFKRNFISDGGRVVDSATARKQTVSEAQAYALFFALVANDRLVFDKLLNWTQDNLAQGDLTAHLPAWQWGKRDDDSWGVIDDNSAADADLWLAYTLGRAGKLWRAPRYSALSALIAGRIVRSEVVDAENLGNVLLPGSVGFREGEHGWRLNPSYLPLQVLKRLALDFPDTAWPELLQSSTRIVMESAPQGLAPDWVQYQASKGFLPDSDHPNVGGYDAIRVYLWAGMMSAKDPVKSKLMQRLHGMADYLRLHAVPPETVDSATGNGSGDGSSGFSAALLPYLAAQQDRSLLKGQLQRLQARPVNDRPNAYYDHVLALFGQGWQQRWFAFTADGALQTEWKSLCAN